MLQAAEEVGAKVREPPRIGDPAKRPGLDVEKFAHWPHCHRAGGPRRRGDGFDRSFGAAKGRDDGALLPPRLLEVDVKTCKDSVIAVEGNVDVRHCGIEAWGSDCTAVPRGEEQILHARHLSFHAKVLECRERARRDGIPRYSQRPRDTRCFVLQDAMPRWFAKLAHMA